MPLPEKLKKDAILEAICEVRFETDELDELVIGRLSESASWEKFTRIRLPISDFPAPVRKNDVNLRYPPIVELRDNENPRAVKIGSNVISAHVIAPYCGWHVFRPQLHEVLDILFTKFKSIQLPRIGLRYINAIVSTDHHIKDISALKLQISIDGAQLNFPFSLAYSKATKDLVAVVKVASPALVIGSTLPPNFVALIDVDVSTPDKLMITEPQVAKDWLESAHAAEKEEFFRLWPEDALSEARER
jgi:uncharacterized protein (TIGR04255 family)